MALVFRKYLDLPVFLLANVAIDIEVLLVNAFDPGWPVHRYGHTLLFGTCVGLSCGILAIALRGLFKSLMNFSQLKYDSNFSKMLISGAIGGFLHVVIDAFYYYDVKLFWPSDWQSLWRIISQPTIKMICLAFFVPAAVLYAYYVFKYYVEHSPITKEVLKNEKTS